MGKILMIVDDDRDDRFFFINAVRKVDAAFVCLVAQNGEEALQQLKITTDLPDYIFLDINMPVMGGKACLIELKKDHRLRAIPVIIYSTSMNQPEIEELSKLGSAYYLTKPNDTNTLPAQIAKAMEVAATAVENQ